MPRTRTTRRKRNNCESPDWFLSFLSSMSSDLLTARQPRPRRTRSKRTSSIVTPNFDDTMTPTKSTNESVILLDDSDDECLSTVVSRTKQISQNASNKVDDFFKSNGLLSDDEDESFQNPSSSNKSPDTDLNKPGVSGLSTLNSNENIVVLEDDTNEIGTVQEIQNYCKEAEEIFKNAKAVLEKFTGSEVTKEPKPQEELPEKKNETTRKGIGECPICYESFSEKQVMTTKCGHLFCKVCIEKVAVAIRKCPTCRKPVTKKTLISIYI